MAIHLIIWKYYRNTLEGCEEGGGERPKGEVGNIGLRKNGQLGKFKCDL